MEEWRSNRNFSFHRLRIRENLNINLILLIKYLINKTNYNIEKKNFFHSSKVKENNNNNNRSLCDNCSSLENKFI